MQGGREGGRYRGRREGERGEGEGGSEGEKDKGRAHYLTSMSKATILTLAIAHEYVSRYTSRIVCKKTIKGFFKDVKKTRQKMAPYFHTII